MNDWDKPIVNHSHNLNAEQVVRLLRMTEMLRENPEVLETVMLMKQSEKWDAALS